MSQQLALQLLGCIQEMAEQESNPVLQVINNISAIAEFKKYPAEKLLFGSTGWGAYYHCHGEPFRFENEHGHFHLFYQDEKQSHENKWTHVIALSMDAYGQPRQWFTVNAWVTDEQWKTAEQLSRILERGQCDDDSLILVEQWLLLMMQLYVDEIKVLQQQRDDMLNSYAKGVPLATVLINKDYYLLSREDVNLQEKLNAMLVG